MASSSASTSIIKSMGSPAFVHASKPPAKCPIIFSNPTRASLTIDSFSVPGSQTSSIALSNGKILPANSAKRPSKPMLIAPGIKPCVNKVAFLVSKITGSNVVICSLKDATVNAFKPFAKTVSKLS